MHSLSLRPGDSLTIPRMASPIGFRSFGFPPACYPDYAASGFYHGGTDSRWTLQPSLDAQYFDPTGPLQRLVGLFTSIRTVAQAISSLSPNGSLFQKTRIAHITHPVTSMVTRPVLNRRCPAAGKRIDFDLFTIIPNKNDCSDSKTIIIGGNIQAGKSLPSILEDMSSRKE